MSLLSVSLTSLKDLVILAPPGAVRRGRFDHVWRSNQTYSRLLSDMQRLRGRIYLEDGAIPPSALTPDGRHDSEFDKKSWHLLTVNSERRVLGCIRIFRPALSRFDILNMRRAKIAKLKEPGPQLRKSVRLELAAARKAGFSYVEIGGWALAEELRNTAEAVRGVLATYAWSRHTGGALGVSAATERNGSRLILRRLGGESLNWEGQDLPPYYDHQFRCKMELLRFDSRKPNPKYNPQIEIMREAFSKIPVVCPVGPSYWDSFRSSLRRIVETPLWTEELIAGFC